MTARKRLDEMKQFIKIAEGAWALPRSKKDFDKLAAILGSDLNNAQIQDKIYNVLGDDSLFDRLDKLEPQGFEAPEVIKQWMKDSRIDEYSNFPNIWNTYQLSQREDSPMNEDENDARGKMCPVCTGGRREGYGNDCPNCDGEGYLNEVGEVKHDDYGATPVYEDDPEGMGSYDVVIRSAYGEDYQTAEPIPYHHAEIEAESAIKNILANIAGESLVKKIPAGSDMKYKIIDVDQDEVFWVVIENASDDYSMESINLDSIVENVLQEYPGQPKDYDDLGPAAKSKSQIVKDIGKERDIDVVDVGLSDYDPYDEADQREMADDMGEIDPEYEDSELGFRFD